MTNTVLLKRSGTANATPIAGALQYGELALNYADGNLFYKNSSNVVTVIASNQFVSVTGNVTGGNVFSSGQISTSGNITATGNVSGGNLTTVGQVSATGNITGNYFIGNGSQLTGIGGGQTIGGNLVVYTRTGSFNVLIVSGYLNIVGRSGIISVPLAA